MPANKNLFVSIACFVIVMLIGMAWASAEPAVLDAVQRMLISLIIAFLLSLALFFLLRQREIVDESRREVEKTDLARDEFAASISHEIRTPLAGILGVMHLLNRTALDRNQQRYVDTATNSANMLLNIINDVVGYARLDTEGLPIESEYFDLNEVIEDVTSILAPEALNKGLELVCDVDPNIPYRIKGDALRLRQILNSLLNNAIKYTINGVVAIYARNLGAGVEIGVRDTGIGINPEKVDRLLQTSTDGGGQGNNASNGPGVGLRSSRRLLGAMGSRLQVESEPGKGSRFYFEIKVDGEHGAAYDWKPPQALQQLSVGIMSPLDLQRSTIRNMLKHWQIDDIREFDCDVEDRVDIGDLSPCDLLIIDQTESEQSVNDLIDRLRNSSDWRDTRFVHLVPQHRLGEKGSADVRLYKPISHSRLYTTVMDIVYKMAYSSEYGSDEELRESAAAGVLSGRRILLAEDNDINKMIVLEMLDETGVDVDVAVNGAEAIEQLGREHYDLILMDVQMPVMDGYQATREIRAMGGRYETIPIIAMTAHALEGDSGKSLDAGMDFHVSKPFEPDDLIALIRRYIDAQSK